MDKDIQKGLFYGASQVFSFIVSGLVGAILGFSITKETIPAVLFAIGGGFIGVSIFIFWWKTMKSPKVTKILKALIFTVIIIGGIVLIIYVNI